MTVPRVHNRHHHSAPSGAVYVGRGTKWGNSFQIGEHGTREQCLPSSLTTLGKTLASSGQPKPNSLAST